MFEGFNGVCKQDPGSSYGLAGSPEPRQLTHLAALSPPLQRGCSFEPIFDQSSLVSASVLETVKTFTVREPQELVAHDFIFFFFF